MGPPQTTGIRSCVQRQFTKRTQTQPPKGGTPYAERSLGGWSPGFSRSVVGKSALRNCVSGFFPFRIERRTPHESAPTWAVKVDFLVDFYFGQGEGCACAFPKPLC